jgi:hypothetical protein
VLTCAQSEEMISVEDDLDDSMDIDEVVDSMPAADPSPAPIGTCFIFTPVGS